MHLLSYLEIPVISAAGLAAFYFYRRMRTAQRSRDSLISIFSFLQDQGAGAEVIFFSVARDGTITPAAGDDRKARRRRSATITLPDTLADATGREAEVGEIIKRTFSERITTQTITIPKMNTQREAACLLILAVPPEHPSDRLLGCLLYPGLPQSLIAFQNAATEHTEETVLPRAQDSDHDADENEAPADLPLTVLGTLIHQLRNPLSSIKMGLGMIARRATLEESENRCLELATIEVRTLEHILSALSEYVKPLELNTRECCLNDIIQVVLKPLIPELETEGIQVVQDLSDNLPSLQFDIDRMQKVILAVIHNSRRAMLQGGTLTLASETTEKGGILLEIKDTGIGMDDEIKTKVFNPFFSDRGGSIGLGLTLTKRVVEAHGGTVKVISRKGKGTTVRFLFSPY